MAVPWALTPPYFLVLGFLSGVVGFRIGWRIGSRIALPLVQALAGWGAFLLAWTILGAGWAAAVVGSWCIGTTVVSVYSFLGRPGETDARVVRAEAYRGVMLDWLASGRGPETRPLATITQHIRELVRYLAAAALTGNLVSMAMGAMLLNMMNAYVATLLRASTRLAVVVALAWNVWSIVRVAAYVMLGASVASPLLALAGMPRGGGSLRVLAYAGAAGVVLDLVLKLALSRPCGRLLARAVDLEAAAASRSSEAPLTLDLS